MSIPYFALDDLSAEELEALKAYKKADDLPTGESACFTLNAHLRGGLWPVDLEAGLRRISDALDAVFARAPRLEAPLSVFRAVGTRSDIPIEKGAQFRNLSFWSSAARESATYSFLKQPAASKSDGAILELELPAGLPVYDMESLGGMGGHETEFLLPRGILWEVERAALIAENDWPPLACDRFKTLARIKLKGTADIRPIGGSKNARSREKRVPYGNRKAGVLCNLSQSAQLDLLAQGLPIIFASASSFWESASQLEGHDREVEVLTGFATEEAAKILILMDIVRCPPPRRAQRIGHMVGLFYDHLSRLLYAEAQAWKPTSVAELRQYVDNSRAGHYLEGGMSEYILPNWARYSRESSMYADIEVHENEAPIWNDPLRHEGIVGRSLEPLTLNTAEAMQALGMFSRKGLQAVSDVWGELEFAADEHSQDARRLTRVLLERLEAQGLIAPAATNEHAGILLNRWQMPMYNLEFAEMPAKLDVLLAEREAVYWSEVGYEGGY